MVRSTCLGVWAAVALAAAGCGSGVREEQIEIKQSNDPLFLPRSALQHYADGQPLSSEVSGFPKMVEDVRKVDPLRADILEKGLAAIQEASPDARPALAKKLLTKLQSSMK